MNSSRFAWTYLVFPASWPRFCGLAVGTAYIRRCVQVMLLGFVLLGRTLEARARAKAATDVQALAVCEIPLVKVKILIDSSSDL